MRVKTIGFSASLAFLSLFFLVASCFATTYYVSPTGNDNNSGLSDSQAWATIAKVNASRFQPGDKVLFKCGGTWTTTSQLNVSWGGSATASAVITSVAGAANGNTEINATVLTGNFANGSITIEGTKDYDGTYAVSNVSGATGKISFTIPKAHAASDPDNPGYAGLMGFAHLNLVRGVLGAYYMNNGVAIEGVSGAKPIIDGEYTSPDPNFPADHGLPTNYRYQAAVYIYNPYTRVENLEVRDQWRYGIFDGSTSSRGSCGNGIYAVINNCTVHHDITIGILGSDVYSLIITNNNVYDCARDGLGSTEQTYTTYNSCAVCSEKGPYTIVRYNTVYKNYGEAFIAGDHTPNNLIEYNTFYDNMHSVGPYICRASYTTLRYNLIYDGSSQSDQPYWAYLGNGKAPMWGIACVLEEFTGDGPNGTGYADIYGNLIANVSTGICISGGRTEDNFTSYNYNIYNNTIIYLNSGTSTTTYPSGIVLSGNITNINIKNNIIWNPLSNPHYIPALLYGGTKTNMVWDYNLWSSQPSAAARGAHDPAYAAPLTEKTTGWDSLTGGSLTGSEFSLQPTSPAIGAGIVLGSPYAKALELSGVNFTTKTFLLAVQSSSGFDIGAGVPGSTVKPLLPPGDVRLLLVQ